jgi:dienelactone hydrolase
MCHEATARPPLPPISGRAGVASSRSMVLEAADGNRFRAFGATAIDPQAPAVVILPDVRGLHPFYEQLAVRFAEVGIHATAIDYFGRTAELDERDEDFDFRAHVPQITTEGLKDDVAAGIAFVRSYAGGGADSVFAVGFCLGGRFSFNTAADQDVDGVIGFYGGPQGTGPDDERAPVRLAPSYRRRCSVCSAGRTSTSRRRRSIDSGTPSPTPGSRTRSSSTTAPRTRSSIGPTNSTGRRATTRGDGCCGSSAARPPNRPRGSARSRRGVRAGDRPGRG